MITFRAEGDFKNIEKFLKKAKQIKMDSIFHKYGEIGVNALKAATPVKTGKTAASWAYEVHYSKSSAEIVWTNNNEVNGFNVAIGLQYGHGTGWGGFVKGQDYINPAMRPIFDKLAEELWKEVTSA